MVELWTAALAAAVGSPIQVRPNTNFVQAIKKKS